MPAEFNNDIIWADWEAHLEYEDFQIFKEILRSSNLPRRYVLLMFAENRLSLRYQYQVSSRGMQLKHLKAMNVPDIALYHGTGLMAFVFGNDTFIICTEASIKFYGNYDRCL